MIKINFIKPSVTPEGGVPKKKPAVGKPLVIIAIIGLIGYGAYYMMITDRFSDLFDSFNAGFSEDSRFTEVTDIGKANPDDTPQVGADVKSADIGDAKKLVAADTKAVVKPEEKPVASVVPASTPPPAAAPEPAPVAVSLPAALPASVSEPAAVAAAPRTQAQSPKPSSLVRTNMIENVVRELGNESRAVKKFDAAYEDMSTVEKINYEVLFARNAFELVTRSVPPGVRLRTVEIENFRTVYISGVSPSREMVQELFSAFRRMKGELLPRPFSNIKDDAGGGFQFVVTSKPRFGLELDDPFQALDHLGFKESLTANLRKFSNLARSNNFKMRAAPSQISVDRVGSYRRVVYRAEGESTYRDFHKFVLALYDEKVPCAFRKITLTARNNDVVHVSAEILFTVKE
jgi:hypothetical protein